MGSNHLAFNCETYSLLFVNITQSMASRINQVIQNLQNAHQNDGKRITRSSRRVLGELPLNTQSINPVRPKDNVVDNISKGRKPRLIKTAARRLVVPLEDEVPMDVENVEVADVILPAGVKDIDEDDASNPQLCSEYAKETFVYLKQLELRGAIKPDFLAGCPTSDKMRAVLVDWLVEVQIQFKLLQETLFLTVDTIDRFLALEGKTLHRSKLQLVGVAAMFLVSKIEEVYAPAISDFVYITDNAYSGAEIRQMELQIIRALNFNMFQPISLHFLRRFSKAGDVDVLQHSLAKYTLEVCLLDYNLVSTPGSLLAAASLCLSLLLLVPSQSLETVWNQTLSFYSGYTPEQDLEVVPKLATNMSKMHRSTKLQAVRNKYKSGKFMKVADLGGLKSERLSELASLK